LVVFCLSATHFLVAIPATKEYQGVRSPSPKKMPPIFRAPGSLCLSLRGRSVSHYRDRILYANLKYVREKFMKTKIVAIFILASLPLATRAETTRETVPITGNDIVNILKLDAVKNEIDFGSDRYATLRFEAYGHKFEQTLDSKDSKVTLLSYIPSDGGNVKMLSLWFAGSRESIGYSYSVDTTKNRYTKTGIIDGLFTIIAAETKDFKNPNYKIQIIPSDTKP